MMITVFEYTELQSYNKKAQSSKQAYVTKETLEWLIEQYQSNSFSEDIERAPVIIELKKNSFKLGAYVGFIQSPFNNEKIHILPKIEIGDGSPQKSNNILKKMLALIYDLSPKSINIADLDHQDLLLHEWIIKQFLLSLQQLLHDGLRGDYQLIQDSQPFIKGRLLTSKQICKAPGTEFDFELEYDDFNLNGLENRLIKTTLNSVLELTSDPESILMAHDFSLLLENIQPILEPIKMLSNWREDRLYESYSNIKKWCEIILLNISPSFQNGLYKGISLLFSMPHLFEKYVAKCLEVPLNKRLHIQPNRAALVKHSPKKGKLQEWFRLKPDLLMTENKKNVCILDTKWKLINELKNCSQKKYDINQIDLYQMFAYGQKYFDKEGLLILIYPKHSYFKSPLPCFYFSDTIILKVIPFDMEKGCLVGEQDIFKLEMENNQP